MIRNQAGFLLNRYALGACMPRGDVDTGMWLNWFSKIYEEVKTVLWSVPVFISAPVLDTNRNTIQAHCF